jgi:cystathionine beta-lyase/cystathionine gamma-synthase
VTVPDRHVDSQLVYATSPVVEGSAPASTPIYQSSMFTFDDLDAFDEAWSRPDGAFAYTRLGNPTTGALESSLSSLEGAHGTVATASGMAALSAVVFAHVGSGDHVVAQQGMYGGSVALLDDLAARWGIRVSYISLAEPSSLRAVVGSETRLVLLETMTNPHGYVVDLGRIAREARELGVVTAVDNTFATPVLCRPIHFGANISFHSTTKYISGHSDVIGGAICCADEHIHRRVWKQATELGAVLDPFAAWLTARGMQTLSLRMQRHCENARELSQALQDHPGARCVRWPGLADHPTHQTARDVLNDFGGVLTFELPGGRAECQRFLTQLTLARIGPSLGGVVTTLLHPATTSHSSLAPETQRAVGVAPGTLRVAVGLEHHADLVADFLQSLDSLFSEPD